MTDLTYGRVQGQLHRLKLNRIAEQLDPLTEEAAKESWTYLAFLERILDAEGSARRNLQALKMREAESELALRDEQVGLLRDKRRVLAEPPAAGRGWNSAPPKPPACGGGAIARDEVAGLMADLLFTTSPPAGQTRLTEWTREHAATLGIRYASEMARRRARTGVYGKLYPAYSKKWTPRD